MLYSFVCTLFYAAFLYSVFFFFKQKTAYEMRISDWSSDVCSSDLGRGSCPIVGSVIIGLMARFGSDKIRGHGIPEAIEAILYGQSKLSSKVAILKPLSSAISIGTGGPFGAEGPIIMTGGAIGSIFAQRFRSEENTYELKSLMRISSAVLIL